MLHEILTNSIVLKPQIDYLVFLQNHRTPELDILFLNITKFAESIVPYIFVSLCYWLLDKRSGFILFTALQLGMMTKDLLKELAFVKRPWLLSDKVHPVEAARAHAPGYSFPSGHTVRGITAISGISIATWKNNKWLSIFFILLGFSVLFSRNYLGVHTPQDVIVGALTGFLLIFPIAKCIDICEKDKNKYLYLLAILDIFALGVMFFICFKSYPADYIGGKLLVSPLSAKYTGVIHIGMSMGAINGAFLCRRFFPFEPQKYSAKAKTVISLVGLVCSMFILHLLDVYVWGKQCDFKIAFLSGFFSTFFLIGIYPFIFTKLIKEK